LRNLTGLKRNLKLYTYSIQDAWELSEFEKILITNVMTYRTIYVIGVYDRYIKNVFVDISDA